MREYDYMECCASGSCEVCGGIQGMVRAEVARTRWRSECCNGCYYPEVCSEKHETRQDCLLTMATRPA